MSEQGRQLISAPVNWDTVDLVVFDLDGTLYLGDALLPGAGDLVRTASRKAACRFLSNNTSKTPEDTLDKMSRLGLCADVKQILSPLRSLVEAIRNSAIRYCWVLANASVLRWLESQLPDIHLRAPRGLCQCVILAYDDTLTYADLCEAGWRLQDGCVYWITHPDMVCPHPQGPVPDVGSLVELFAGGFRRRPERVFGKPSPEILAPVLAEYSPQRILLIGDRLYTDWELARRVGCQFRLTLNGETTPQQWLAIQGERPLLL